MAFTNFTPNCKQLNEARVAAAEQKI